MHAHAQRGPASPHRCREGRRAAVPPQVPLQLLRAPRLRCPGGAEGACALSAECVAQAWVTPASVSAKANEPDVMFRHTSPRKPTRPADSLCQRAFSFAAHPAAGSLVYLSSHQSTNPLSWHCRAGLRFVRRSQHDKLAPPGLDPGAGLSFCHAPAAPSLACVTPPNESNYGADAGWLASGTHVFFPR